MLDYEKILAGAAQQLDDVIAGLKKAVSLANVARKEANEEELVSKKAHEEALTAMKIVKAREKAVKGKEVNIRTDAALTAARDGVEAGLVALANDRRKFEKECIDKRSIIEQELSNIVVAKKVYKDLLDALDKEKNSYKLKLVEELAKKAGG